MKRLGTFFMIMKRAAGALLAAEGAHLVPLPEKVVVLTVHGVPGQVLPWVNTPPELFKKYMGFLKD